MLMNVNWMWRVAALLLTVVILRAHSRANVAADSLAMVSFVTKVQISLHCSRSFPCDGIYARN